MDGFEKIYEVAAGLREPDGETGWVTVLEDANSDYAAACQTLYDARNALAERFGISPEDPDLERIIHGALTMEKEMALHLFRCGTAYARKL